MIPLRLTVRNFLCYGDGVPPLSLEGIHVACISGENGSGKSALLDALTWALWGEARGRTQEELVRHGRSEMAVELDFEAGGQRYRMLRSYLRPQGGRPQRTFCYLHLLQDSASRLLAEGVTEAEARLRSLLRMDYATFVNTAFLRQGRADEFTQKRPAEKRALLGEILGLQLYRGLEERARASARRKREEAGRLFAQVQRLEEEISLRPRYQAELEGVEASLQELEGQAGKGERLAQGERSQEQLIREVAETEGRVQEYHARREGCRGVLSRAPAIEEGFQRWTQGQKEEAELNRQLLLLSEYERRRSGLRSAIDAARHPLEKTEEGLRRELASLQEQAAREGEYNLALGRAQEQGEAMKGREAAIAQKREGFQALTAALARHEAEAAGLQREIEEMREKEGLLSAEGARCPLCLTELGEEGLHRLREGYQRGLQEKAQALHRCLQERQRVEQELACLRGEVEVEEKGVRQEMVDLQRRLGALSQAREKAAAARAQALVKAQELKELTSRLGQRDYALQEQKELSQVEAALAALSYDPGRHRAVRGEVEGLKNYPGEKQELEKARGDLPLLEDLLAQAQAALREKQQALSQIGEELSRLRGEVASLPGLRQELKAAQDEYQRLRTLRDGALGQRARLQDRIEQCRQREEERGQLQEQLKEAQREESLYSRLGEAFGKTGVPALLVEGALRELEEEADGLLKRLSGGRMGLRFQTLRQRQGREVEEALEVKIADELGTRSYEMFSGGEAFRINFALRVALSRLLARRAGSPLRLLIVDEGFGTQDTEGREKLIEAITTLAPDFDRILVITHLEELKELFPVRIEITKTPQGSTWSLSL